jgi:hypothetical protein
MSCEAIKAVASAMFNRIPLANRRCASVPACDKTSLSNSLGIKCIVVSRLGCGVCPLARGVRRFVSADNPRDKHMHIAFNLKMSKIVPFHLHQSNSQTHAAQEHGHTHDVLDNPGRFINRPIMSKRDWSERAFTVGIGGYVEDVDSGLTDIRPVGSGKTALMLQLCRKLRNTYSIACVTNDIFTQEDTEFLVKNGALPSERIRAIETGGCPHAAIRG